MKNDVAVRERVTPSTRVIEIGGIKMEVDMRHVRKVEHYKVGTNVRVLVKDYNEYKSYGGVIIGFEEFKTRPSILIAYIKVSYGDSSLHFLTYNSDTKDVEICLAEENFIPFERSRVLECLNNSIQTAKEALLEAQNKKYYFEKNFDKYFEEAK